MSKKKKKKTLRAAKSKPVEFDDNTLMYFGKHKNTKLANLPDHYCLWLLEQDWIKDHKTLHTYLLDNEDCFMPSECDTTQIDLY